MLNLITEYIDIWTAAQLRKANGGRGRGKNSNGQSFHGIKKLRELILELSVRGKLVPQDPNDEPARVLLENIAKEKKRLIKAGKIKKQKKLPDIREEEKPFDLPLSWEWTRLGDITNYGILEKAEPEDVSKKTWILELKDVEKETSKLLQKIRFRDRQFRSSKNRFYERDVIYGKLRPYLDKVIVADESGVCTTEMIPLKGYKYIAPPYLRLVMKSPYFIRYANESTHGMNLPRMGTVKARLALFPLVPESEQHRIVAKVDELMSLCDQLEQQQTDSITTHQTLVETLLAALTSVADQDEFAKTWLQITDHFDTLFTTEQSVDLLKQTILQLAVMGKLVLQDTNDEPAYLLLEKIAKEKKRLIKKGKVKKQKELPEISAAEQPFELPEGWEFIRLEKFVDITSGVTKGRKLSGRELVSVPYLRVANVQRGYLELDQIKEIDLPVDELTKFSVFKRDLLITEGGDWDKVGRTAIWQGGISPIVHQNHIFKARCIIEEQNEVWIEKYLNSLLAREYFAKSSKQTTNLASINKTQLRGCIIAIPPLAEQQRIVTMINGIMLICDGIKAKLQDVQATAVQLANAIVENAVA